MFLIKSFYKVNTFNIKHNNDFDILIIRFTYYQYIKINIFYLVVAHHDEQALIEKIDTIMRELEEEKNTLERVKREATARAEQERNNTNQLRDELNRLKTKLDETKLRANEEKLKLDLKIEELWKERESTQREVEELQVQLHMTEDKVDGLQNQLHDTIRKLKDGSKLSSTICFFSRS